MSTPQIQLPDGTAVTANTTRRILTYREARYVSARLRGLEKREAAKDAGFTGWQVVSPGRAIETPAVLAALEEASEILADHVISAGLVDTAELWQYASDALRSDIADIKHRRKDCDCGTECTPGTYRDVEDWPLIWRQMAEGGDLEIEPSSERSHDGETKDKAGGWDVVGQVTKVKYRFGSKQKWAEFLARLKPVDSFVNPNDKLVDAIKDLSIRWQGPTDIIDVTPVQAQIADLASTDGDH